MDTLTEYHNKINNDETLSLKTEITKLTDRNLSLTNKNRKLYRDAYSSNKHRNNLLKKQEAKVNLLARLWVKGVLDMTKQGIADLLFVDVAYINNSIAKARKA